MIRRIAFIGFGEVGRILADDLSGKELGLSAFDLKFADDASGPSASARAVGIWPAPSAAEAAAGCDLVISAVTAAQTSAAAVSVTGALSKNTVFLDLNSASPGVKRHAAEAVQAAGARYVEAAVMSPVPPKRIATPMLLGGPHAQAFLPEALALGLSGASFFSEETGKASAAKMCRSVMVKGIEALLTESLLSARSHGVEDTVLKSLDDLFPGPDWPVLARYMVSRALEHGIRRAEEMREAARTVAETGLDPLMSLAAAERQGWAAKYAEAGSEAELGAMLDAIHDLMVRKGAAA